MMSGGMGEGIGVDRDVLDNGGFVGHCHHEKTCEVEEEFGNHVESETAEEEFGKHVEMEIAE